MVARRPCEAPRGSCHFGHIARDGAARGHKVGGCRVVIRLCVADTGPSAILPTVEQLNGPNVLPVHAAGDRSGVRPRPDLPTPGAGGEAAEKTRHRKSGRRGSSPRKSTPEGPKPPKPPSKKTQWPPPQEAESEKAKADGPSFEVSDRRGSITADHTGVRFRLDGEEAEFAWDEIGAVEIDTPRFSRRFTVVVYTTNRHRYENDVEASAKNLLKEWTAELDGVLDTYFEDAEASPTRPSATDQALGHGRSGHGRSRSGHGRGRSGRCGRTRCGRSRAGEGGAEVRGCLGGGGREEVTSRPAAAPIRHKGALLGRVGAPPSRQAGGELREQPTTGRWSGCDRNSPSGQVSLGARGTARATDHRPVVRMRPQQPLWGGDDVQPRRGLSRSSPRPWVRGRPPRGHPTPGENVAPPSARTPPPVENGAALREGTRAGSGVPSGGNVRHGSTRKGW